MIYTIHYSCLTHIGKRRSTNQDNFLCDGKYRENACETSEFSMSGSSDTSQPRLFAVFDGMGGEECGEMASWIAADCAAKFKVGDHPPEDLLPEPLISVSGMIDSIMSARQYV